MNASQSTVLPFYAKKTTAACLVQHGELVRVRVCLGHDVQVLNAVLFIFLLVVTLQRRQFVEVGSEQAQATCPKQGATGVLTGGSSSNVITADFETTLARLSRPVAPVAQRYPSSDTLGREFDTGKRDFSH